MEKIKIELTKEDKTETLYEGNSQAIHIVLSAIQIRDSLVKNGYCPDAIIAIADTLKAVAGEYI